MKLVRFDTMQFIVEGGVAEAMEGNQLFLSEWKDNPVDERYPQYLSWAKNPDNYKMKDLDLGDLDSLIRCEKWLYMGRYGNALVFNE